MKPTSGTSLPADALAAFADIDSAEEEGNKEVAKLFKKTARDWQSWLRAMTGKTWKVKPGDYTLSMTSPKGKMIDVMWDFDPMFNKVDITVEGPGGKRRVFTRQPMGRVGGGKRAASEYLSWIVDSLMESRGDILDVVLEMEEGVSTKASSVSELRSILDGSVLDEARYLSSPPKTNVFSSPSQMKTAVADARYRLGAIRNFLDGGNARKVLEANDVARFKRLISHAQSDLMEIEAELDNYMTEGVETAEPLTEKRMGREAGSGKGIAKHGSEVKHGSHPMEKSGKPGARKKQKKAYNKAVRRNKRKEIEKRMAGEATLDNAIAYLDALVQEGIDCIPVLGADDNLIDEDAASNVMVKALKNLAAVARNFSSRGAQIEKWASNAISTGQMDVRSLLDAAKKANIDRDAKALAAAIGRVVSLAAAMIGESESVLEMDAMDRTAVATDPKFRAYIKSLTGKRNPSYTEIMKALMSQGLDRKTAGQYAMFATDMLGESADSVMDASDIASEVPTVGPDPYGREEPAPSEPVVTGHTSGVSLGTELQMILRGDSLSDG